jgi:hypothetical protein
MGSPLRKGRRHLFRHPGPPRKAFQEIRRIGESNGIRKNTDRKRNQGS